MTWQKQFVSLYSTVYYNDGLGWILEETGAVTKR